MQCQECIFCMFSIDKEQVSTLGDQFIDILSELQPSSPLTHFPLNTAHECECHMHLHGKEGLSKKIIFIRHSPVTVAPPITHPTFHLGVNKT